MRVLIILKKSESRFSSLDFFVYIYTIILKKMIKVQDIKPGDVYLANHYFNSKKITFQPCKIISGEVVKNQNGYDTVEVEFWNGSTKKIFVREGEFKDTEIPIEAIREELKNML